jgi:S1-C subfamily serine protease
VRNETDVLGVEFEEVSAKEKEELGIGNGIKIKSVGKGKLQTTGLKKGFIVTSVNKKPIFEVRDFKREIGNARGGILVEGMYENGEPAYFVFGLD